MIDLIPPIVLKMPFSIVPKLKLKAEGTKEGPPPLSLANLLEEGCPSQPCIRRTATKPYNFGSSHSLSRRILIVNAIVKEKLLSWYLGWSGKNNVSSSFVRAGIEEGDKEGVGDLPLELWGEIGKRLSSRLDILRFRSVCKKWRSSLPFPTCFPLWVPPAPRGEGEGTKEVPFIITQVSVFHCEWVRGYIVLQEVDQDGIFYAHRLYCSFLGDGISTKFYCPKISFMSWWFFPYNRLSFISNAYHLRRALPRIDDPTQLDYHYNSFTRRIVIISSNADNVNLSYVSLSDLSVVALVSEGSMKGRLALLRLGGCPENWVWDSDFCTQVFLDITTYKGRLCALHCSGGVYLMDYNSFEMTQLSPPWPQVCKMRGNKYLFEVCGDLYLANFDFSNGKRLLRYKLNFRSHKWVTSYVSLDPLLPSLIDRGRVFTS